MYRAAASRLRALKVRLFHFLPLFLSLKLFVNLFFFLLAVLFRSDRSTLVDYLGFLFQTYGIIQELSFFVMSLFF